MQTPVSQQQTVSAVISYDSRDRSAVEPLAAVLKAAGLTIWLADPDFNGVRFRDEIEERIDGARVVLAVWTENSVKVGSNVYLDAKSANEAEKLISVRLDNADLPWGFRDRRAIDLAGWTGQAGDPRLDAVLKAVERVAKRTDDTWDGESELPGVVGLANNVAKAAVDGREAALREATALLNTELARDADGLSMPDVRSLLEVLRDQRAHEQVIAIAETVMSRGETSIRARRLYAQSLIDTGKLNAAISLLEATAAPMDLAHDELPEVMGLLGRAYKQMYVNDRRSKKAEQHLCSALTFYADGVRATIRREAKKKGMAIPADDKVRVEEDAWNGINVVALQARAARDELSVDSYCDVEEGAKKLIDRIGVDSADPWDQATLGEACVARRDFKGAAEHYGRFLASASTTPFHINSALRQLKEVWQLKDAEPEAAGLIAGMEARLVTSLGGSLQYSPSDLAAKKVVASGTASSTFQGVLKESIDPTAKGVNFGRHESVMGGFVARPRDWFEMMLERTSAVGRVYMQGNQTVGSGFLVKGRALDERFGDEVLFLTNSHVVSEGLAAKGLQRLGLDQLTHQPLSAQRIRIRFDFGPEGMERRGYACQLIWESPVAEHDVALLRFYEELPKIETCPIAPAMPPLKVQKSTASQRNARVFVIGHPNGGDLSVAIEDSGLRQIGPKEHWGAAYRHIEFLHYRTPTEPGSSGSPIFEENSWEVIGIHHLGSGDGRITSLDGKRAWRANEGVSIFSIRDAIRKAFDSGDIKPRTT